MKEAKIIYEFKDFLNKNPNHIFTIHPSCIEFKICKEKRFPFKNVAVHQREYLNLLSEGHFFYKIQDEPFRGAADSNRFHAKKPFDAVFITQGTLAYIAICFYQPRKLKRLFFFPINDFLEFEKKHDKKSFTELEARSNCAFFMDLIKPKI